MSDVQNTPNAPADNTQAIAALKRKADTMGVTYRENVSVATLQKLIQDKLEPKGESKDKADETKGAASETKDAETLIKEAHKLVRVIILPNEQTKASNHESELVSAGNSVVGTVTRLVMFGVEWHVEQIILNALREKKFQMFTKSKESRYNQDVVTTKYLPAYNIQVLDQLTPDELDDLARQQQRSGAIDY